MIEFEKLGLSPDIVETLAKKGYKTPTAIQEQTIPLLLAGEHDVIGQAQTGTGKTASFSLPIIETITPDTGAVQALILAPTRELAIQVSKEVESLSGKRKLSILPVYGGSSITNQIKALRKGVDIVVGTPGRIMDLMRRKELHINKLQYLVLDEADEMLNMGFLDDIKWILTHTKENKRMLFFSATMPRPILEIAKKFMKNYKIVKTESTELTIDTIDQMYFPLKSNQRYAALRKIIAVNKSFHGLIFCKTKRTVDELSTRLINHKYPSAALHGDVTQGQREKILSQFRKGNIRVLVATDVAARGIDVNDMTHVINYSLPQNPEIYVHRIGRTGRAGKQGVAITFVIPSETKKLKGIERITKKQIRLGRLPSTEEVMQSQKDDLVRSIRRIINKRNSSQFMEIANILLETDDPVTVVSALLKNSLGNELDGNGYDTEVEEYVAKDKKSYQGRAAKRTNRRGGRSPEAKDRKRFNRKGPRRDNRSSNAISSNTTNSASKREGGFNRGKSEKSNRSRSKSSDNKKSASKFSKPKKSGAWVR
jgi:ATP-dependent RNA helicase DeaD